MNLPTIFNSNNSKPSRALARLHEEFDRLFREMERTEPLFSSSELNPSCEVSESKTNYTMKCDMPGVKKDDVQIGVEGNDASDPCLRRLFYGVGR